ncbi:Uncharacterised protein [Klebsiella pneumoniae]|nr:Uncharacterised protein [Klebsiella pneumoniae]
MYCQRPLIDSASGSITTVFSSCGLSCTSQGSVSEFMTTVCLTSFM